MRLKVLSALMQINYINRGIEAARYDIQVRFAPQPQAKQIMERPQKEI